ncbi:sugar phosphate isomerase/epimerase [Paenibacillus sp. HWE-109]|uniref:sugar phosphate isomerase/epimerase family protein n=1 Tax=Paenibacillus sp. HWE-109 TaxID=1306526 RepID=UPI001EDDEA94|nr:sugar phosphate isomerase/epimerase family protein [Paenibacillus sp. HWE-109]UKS30964.1 sugar phosphate isomerase/epimerase [Paenibacillus sp. HWE-109]
MVWERLGVLTDEVSAHFEEALDWAAEQGLKHVEIRVINGQNAADLDNEQVSEIRRQVEARGLFISAIASPLFKCALDPSRQVAAGDTFGQREESVQSHFAKLDRVITIANMLGTTRIRIFSFWREADPASHRDEIVRYLQQAAVVAEARGVQLLLENEPACNGGYAEEVAVIVRAVASPALRGLWDPGNEAYGGLEAFPAGYTAMKDVLAHVHLKDAYIREDGLPHCVPLGSGNVPVIAQLKALLADDYNGLFTIETHYVPVGGNQMMGTLMSLQALRVLMSEV